MGRRAWAAIIPFAAMIWAHKYGMLSITVRPAIWRIHSTIKRKGNKMTIQRMIRHAPIVLICSLLAIGCSRKSGVQQQARQSKTTNTEGRTLTLYNWEDYIGASTLETFEQETGIHVEEVNFTDEEEMLGAVQSNLSAYDLVVVSDDGAREMIAAKLLHPFDYSKIPNMRHIGPHYLNQRFDPNQEYTVPYLIGSSGMVINKRYIEGPFDSWKVLWDTRYKGKIAMLNNPSEVFAAGCKLLGYSINTSHAEELAMTKSSLIEQKSLVAGYYDVVTIQDLMGDERLWAAHIYSGEGMVLSEENEDIEYVIPREGAAVWMDVFVMPRDAKHPEEAHTFLDYILQPEINAAIASEYWYATPNKEAEPLMDPEILVCPSVYPPGDVMGRCEFFKGSGENLRFVQSLWTELTSAQ